jgi:hypothetical protein
MTMENEALQERGIESASEQKRPSDQAIWFIWLFLALVGGVLAYTMSQRQPATATVWVPVKDLPAYHLIIATDVITKTVTVSAAASKHVPVSATLDLRYTQQPLFVGQAIQENHLVPAVSSTLASGTVPVSLPATSAMVFNGRLTSGVIVTVWQIADAGKAESLLDKALVLNVQKVEDQGKSEEYAYPYVIVLAVPQSIQVELLTAVTNHTIWFTIQQQ